jgi:hypothetical protein
MPAMRTSGLLTLLTLAAAPLSMALEASEARQRQGLSRRLLERGWEGTPLTRTL